jgi:hypothetical protein
MFPKPQGGSAPPWTHPAPFCRDLGELPAPRIWSCCGWGVPGILHLARVPGMLHLVCLPVGVPGMLHLAMVPGMLHLVFLPVASKGGLKESKGKGAATSSGPVHGHLQQARPIPDRQHRTRPCAIVSTIAMACGTTVWGPVKEDGVTCMVQELCTPGLPLMASQHAGQPQAGSQAACRSRCPRRRASQ